MKLAIGMIMVVAGAALGLYLGVWVMLIGGVVQFVEGIKANPVDGMDIALGVGRVLCAAFTGWAAALALIIPGILIVSSDR